MIHPKVFISYSHDSQEHIDRVLGLADILRNEGVDANLDQYVDSPSEGWPRWMQNQIREATFALVICTEIYYCRFVGREVPGQGLGATWEGAIITQELYESSLNNSKFIPVLLDSNDSQWIPCLLKGVTHYDLTKPRGYELLYRRLTGQPSIIVPSLGSVKMMPPLERKQIFTPVVTGLSPLPASAKQSGIQGVATHRVKMASAMEIPNFHIHNIKETIRKIAIRDYDFISTSTAEFLLQICLASKKHVQVPSNQQPMPKDFWLRLLRVWGDVTIQQDAYRRSWLLTKEGRKVYDALFVDNDSIRADQIIGQALLRNPIIGLIFGRFNDHKWRTLENVVNFLQSRGISCWSSEIELLLEELSAVGIVTCSAHNRNFRIAPFLKMPE